MSGGTYSLSRVQTTDFWETIHDNFIYSQSFCQKSAERQTPKKYFFHIFVLIFDLWFEPWPYDLISRHILLTRLKRYVYGIWLPYNGATSHITPTTLSLLYSCTKLVQLDWNDVICPHVLIKRCLKPQNSTTCGFIICKVCRKSYFTHHLPLKLMRYKVFSGALNDKRPFFARSWRLRPERYIISIKRCHKPFNTNDFVFIVFTNGNVALKWRHLNLNFMRYKVVTGMTVWQMHFFYLNWKLWIARYMIPIKR